MADKDFRSDEFDEMLESLELAPPSDILVHEVTPWRKAMNRVLWGLGLCTLTLNVGNIDTICIAIGMILMVLGYRTLRRENRWFRVSYWLTILRVLLFLGSLFLNSTIWNGSEWGTAVHQVLVLFGTPLHFALFFCLWGGIREVQKKAGLPPHAGSAVALLIWYGIVYWLAFMGYSGVLGWVLIIAYGFILRGLYKLSRELDQAGYLISPAPVTFSDRTVKIVYAAAIFALLAVGYTFFAKFPMAWAPQESSQSQIRQELLELGFPEDVLNDLTEEDLLACAGSEIVLVETDYYDTATANPVDPAVDRADYPFAVADSDTQVCITNVAVRLPGLEERWKIIHHFRWLYNPGFPGTESIRLRPADTNTDNWDVDEKFTGQVLYDEGNVTYCAPHYSLGRRTTQTDPAVAGLFGFSGTSNNVFAEFSFPDSGENHRGYVAYDTVQVVQGKAPYSWFNFLHTQMKFQYPAVTAAEAERSGVFNDGPYILLQPEFTFVITEDGPVALG